MECLIELGINSVWAGGTEGAASMCGSPLISWKLLKGGKFIVLVKMSPETELESFWTEVAGLSFSTIHGCQNLMAAEESFLLSWTSKAQSLSALLLIPKCFQRRQPEGEEVVLIKSSLCFPGTGAFHRCLLGSSSHSAANTEAGFPFPKAQIFLHRLQGTLETHFLPKASKRWQTCKNRACS